MIKELLDKIFRPRTKKTEHEKPTPHSSEASKPHSTKSRPILGTKKTAKKNQWQ
jgi:hypothetical protein